MESKILTIVGARPQFVKAATITRAVKHHPSLKEVMVHTGQHFDSNMSDIFFQELDIPEPRYNLEIHGGTHGAMTGRMMEKLEAVVIRESPDLVLVYGDTNSTLAGALVAAKLSLPVAHVEAGLRSFNRAMPEEINRVVADHLSSLLLCPTTAAVDNLRDEGLTEGVHHVGDVMYDATLFALERANDSSSILEDLGLQDGGYALATLHRAENTDDPVALKRAIAWLQTASRDQQVVIPLHPRTHAAAERYGLDFAGLTVCPPVGFLDMTRLLASATAVFTDSGGLQKEAYFHRKPCVTLRGETEWVETLAAGWNRLWDGPDYEARREIADYGDGHSAERTLKLLRGYLTPA